MVKRGFHLTIQYLEQWAAVVILVLPGVVDDRGKFIYISEEELGSVAKFINQNGRVSITDLAAASNR